MIRALRESDLPALLALCQTCLPYDTFTSDLLHRRIFLEPGYNERYLLAYEHDGRLAGVLLASTRLTRNGTEAWLRLFAVAPSLQQHGIAAALLHEIESRLHADDIHVLNTGNSAPDYFYPGVDVRYTPAICWLLKNGFTRSGEAFNMEVPLEGRNFDTAREEAALLARGITFRRLLPEDRPGFEEWMAEQWNTNWLHEALSSYLNDPPTTFVALENGKLCGFASYDVTMFDGYFGPMGTEQRLRGLGIGGILFKRCMVDMQARGYTRCEICWVGPIAFYAKAVGAAIHRVFWWYRKNIYES